MKLIAALCIFAILFGCAPKEPDVRMSDIEKTITSEIDIENAAVTDLRGNMAAAERYGIPLDKIEDGFVYTNEEGGKSADEIIVLKTRSRKSVAEVESALESEITGMTTAWEKAGEEEYEKVQKHILRSKGRYVMLAITNESKKAEEIFKNMLR